MRTASFSRLLLGLAAATLLIAGCLQTARPSATPPVPAVADAPAGVQASLAHLPRYFVENQGQADNRVGYYLLGGGVYFTGEGVTYALTEPAAPRSRDRAAAHAPAAEPEARRQRWAVKLDFVGADPDARPVGQDKTEAVVSYFKGPEAQWRTGLLTYGAVAYPDLWPGIDLVYEGSGGQLKYSLLVRPGHRSG
jgi:hypothetical protein